MKTVCSILIAVALAHSAIDEYEVEPVTSAPEVAAEDFYEASTPAEEGRHTFDDDESDFKPELAQEISKAGSNCPMERGFCVLSNGRDQNSGVRKLAGGDYNTASKKASCLNACRRIRGATGCEVIWHQGNRGCYAHTHSIARGNGVARHTCWVFSKCESSKERVDKESGGSTRQTSCNEIHGKPLEFLDRHHIQCGANEALASFKVVRTGCSGSNQRYEYKCRQATITTSSIKQSGCSHMVGQKLEFLDRQTVACGTNQALMSFKAHHAGCGGQDMRYEFLCGNVQLAAATTKHSSCSLMKGKTLEFLDRQNVECGANEVMTSFKLIGGGCSGDDMRYEFKCAAIDTAASGGHPHTAALYSASMFQSSEAQNGH